MTDRQRDLRIEKLEARLARLEPVERMIQQGRLVVGEGTGREVRIYLDLIGIRPPDHDLVTRSAAATSPYIFARIDSPTGQLVFGASDGYTEQRLLGGLAYGLDLVGTKPGTGPFVFTTTDGAPVAVEWAIVWVDGKGLHLTEDYTLDAGGGSITTIEDVQSAEALWCPLAQLAVVQSADAE